MELLENFKFFLSNIEPTANQKNEASTGHTTLRKRLSGDEEFKEFFIDSFLTGSYARDTAIRPIKDVDIIIIMNILQTNTPSSVINYLERILKKYYSNTKRQTKSVNITLSYINMDVVPAIAPEGIDNILLIPNREEKEWTKTHPKKHIELSTIMNKNRNLLYKPLVKSLKQWRDVRMSETWKPKSFILETIIYGFASANMISSIPLSIRDFYYYVYNKYKKEKEEQKYSPIIIDHGGTGKDVAQKWTLSDFNKFYDECIASWSSANNAIKSEDYTTSVSYWRQLLGNNFPN